MGIKNEDLAQIYEKAKTKKDGVYSFNTHVYGVRNKQCVVFADYRKLYVPYGHFVVQVGENKSQFSSQSTMKTMVKKYMKMQG